MLRTLDDLVTSEGRAPFLHAFATKTRWHSRLSRPDAAQALLPWSVIEGLVGGGSTPAERFRIALNGVDLPSAAYSNAKGLVRSEAVTGFMAQGATLVINDVAALTPAVGELTAELERELRCAIGVNAYVTFGSRSAFSPHCDGHDVVVLQIYGAKVWHSFGSPTPFPLSGVRVNPAPEKIWEDILTPGDVLYLPRGEVHDTAVAEQPSVHLTFGINETTAVDYLRWLSARAKQVPALRQDLGAILQGDDRTQRDRGLADALRGLLEVATTAAFFADHDRNQPLRPLAPLNAAGRFQPSAQLHSALRRRLDLAPHVDGVIPLTLGGRAVQLSPLARRVLTEATATNRISVAELAGRLGLEAESPELIACLEDLATKSLIAIAD